MKPTLLALAGIILLSTIFVWWQKPREKTEEAGNQTAMPLAQDAVLPSAPTEAPSPPKKVSDLPQAQKPIENIFSESTDDPPDSLTKLESLTNKGQSTPADSFETMCWAALNGNEDILSSSFHLNDEDLLKLDAAWEKLSDTFKAEFKSPQNLFGMFFTQELLKNVLAIGFSDGFTSTSDSASLPVVVQTERGTKSREITMVKFDKTWKIPLDTRQVEMLIKKISN